MLTHFEITSLKKILSIISLIIIAGIIISLIVIFQFNIGIGILIGTLIGFSIIPISIIIKEVKGEKAILFQIGYLKFLSEYPNSHIDFNKMRMESFVKTCVRIVEITATQLKEDFNLKERITIKLVSFEMLQDPKHPEIKIRGLQQGNTILVQWFPHQQEITYSLLRHEIGHLILSKLYPKMSEKEQHEYLARAFL